MQFPYDRLETKKDDGSVVRIFCENDDEEASYQWNTVLKRKTVIILWVLKGGGGGYKSHFPPKILPKSHFPANFLSKSQSQNLQLHTSVSMFSPVL